MSNLREKINNLSEYFGIRSASYYHAETPARYDPADFLIYYIDESGRVDYPGPYDENHLPMYIYKGQKYYFPILSCLCSLAHLERYRRESDEKDRQFFLNISRWLIETQKENGVWLNDLPMKKFHLVKSWPSAMMQGLGISCLTRANQLTGNPEYLEYAKTALKPFHVNLENGGVTSHTDGRPFYEEYPSEPTCHVLNGFIFAMWGLYDLMRLIDDESADRLFNDGLATLTEWLPRYDTGYWSLYHIGEGMANPATLHYHRLHIEQLKVMYAITGESILKEYYERWQIYLEKRFNALRTLPKKIMWNLIKGF